MSTFAWVMTAIWLPSGWIGPSRETLQFYPVILDAPRTSDYDHVWMTAKTAHPGRAPKAMRAWRSRMSTCEPRRPRSLAKETSPGRCTSRLAPGESGPL